MSCTQTTNKYTETPQQRTRLIIKKKSHNCYLDQYQRKGKCFLQACASTLQCHQSTTLLLLLLYAALQGYWGAVFNSLVYSFSWLQECSPNSSWTLPYHSIAQPPSCSHPEHPAGNLKTHWSVLNTHEPCEDQPSPRSSLRHPPKTPFSLSPSLGMCFPLREEILQELQISFWPQ